MLSPTMNTLRIEENYFVKLLHERKLQGKIQVIYTESVTVLSNAGDCVPFPATPKLDNKETSMYSQLGRTSDRFDIGWSYVLVIHSTLL